MRDTGSVMWCFDIGRSRDFKIQKKNQLALPKFDSFGWTGCWFAQYYIVRSQAKLNWVIARENLLEISVMSHKAKGDLVLGIIADMEEALKPDFAGKRATKNEAKMSQG